VRSTSNLCITMCLLSALSASMAVGQSNQEWIAYKQKCGIPGGMAYNDWVAAGSKCNAGSTSSGGGTAAGGLTPQQQMAMQSAQAAGYMIGQGLHNILFGQPKPLTATLDPATQQRALAVEQLNNSGIYLLQKNDYAGAINEFQQALNQSPNDANILSNLQLARQRQKNAADAAKTSDALGNLLGTAEANADNAPGGPRSPLSLVNLDPNVVDFRGIGRTSSTNPNSSFLNTVVTGFDSNTVNLANTKKDYIDPKLVQGQINNILGNPVPVPAQSSPQEQIDKLFQPSQSGQASGITKPQPSSEPRVNAPDTEQQTKAKVNAIFSNPAPSSAEPHN
jgi:tetratricopeptide (TPR) repeat protein